MGGVPGWLGCAGGEVVGLPAPMRLHRGWAGAVGLFAVLLRAWWLAGTRGSRSVICDSAGPGGRE